ncbi:FIST signal transduction protein [Flavobacterium rhizosphaerae]|uniref:FIST N-terminal domain-containing protein n=1 Tax=Flavobacterium rhizosphaerae TaxID=3163298 RepID=A0ABW8YZN9_9FLAO
MKIVQAFINKNKKWFYATEKVLLNNPLVLVFGERELLEESDTIDNIRAEFPYEHIVFGSSAGEIFGTTIIENSITVVAVEFEKTSFVVKTANILDYNKNTEEAAAFLSSQMPQEGLKHLLIISEGSFISGSNLIRGLQKNVNTAIPITGGLCGDGSKFEKTIVSYKENPKEGEIALIGLYGESLEVSFSTYCSFIPFGPNRIITKSEGNTVYEIDGQPALDLYKKYLGEKADEPQFTLLYPLHTIVPGKSEGVVRTILSVDNDKNAMIFADEMIQGSKVQLMMVSQDAIIEGADRAAKIAMDNRKDKPQLVFVVSCIGRKLIMAQRVEEEVEQVAEIVGKGVALAGFYSYGEISPSSKEQLCELHNETMALTLISE